MRSRPLMPPQRVTSACWTPTHPTIRFASSSAYVYSPAAIAIPAGARDYCLLAPVRPDHPFRVVERLRVPAHRDRHTGRSAVAHEPHPLELVGGHGLLKVAHAVVVIDVRSLDRLGALERAVDVDV